MMPQHLVCKYELNCEYCNITLARNKAPWWLTDKIETCRSVLKCFKVLYKCFMWNYMCILWLINWSDSTKIHGATIRFILTYWLHILHRNSPLHALYVIEPFTGSCSETFFMVTIHSTTRILSSVQIVKTSSNWYCLLQNTEDPSASGLWAPNSLTSSCEEVSKTGILQQGTLFRASLVFIFQYFSQVLLMDLSLC